MPTRSKANIREYYDNQSGRQGIAILAFEIKEGTIEALFDRYMQLHPKLLAAKYENGVMEYEGTKVFEVYAYYKGDVGGAVDKGTRIRYIEVLNEGGQTEIGSLPGFQQLDATFDEGCMAAYCDHWVSNGEFSNNISSVKTDTPIRSLTFIS